MQRSLQNLIVHLSHQIDEDKPRKHLEFRENHEEIYPRSLTA